MWCYASISLHAGDLWHILHVINLWVKISMLDSDGQIVLLFVGEFIKGWSPVTFSVYLVHIMVDYSKYTQLLNIQNYNDFWRKFKTFF